MKTLLHSFHLLLVAAATVGLAGCLNLKPAQSTVRHFVLSSLPAPASTNTAPSSLAVGVGQVRLPSYLFRQGLAVRKSATEFEYPEADVWAERLDSGVQRVLAANLSVLLPTDKIRLSAWRPEDVSVGLYVTIEQFDVDTAGRGVLVAWWRLVSPGGEKTLRTGECRLTRQGPAPATDPQGATATLSDLVAEMSRQLADAIRQTH